MENFQQEQRIIDAGGLDLMLIGLGADGIFAEHAQYHHFKMKPTMTVTGSELCLF